MNFAWKHDRNLFDLSDEAVIQRILNGENQLFEVLLRRHNQTLYRVIRGYLKDDEDVEDIMQSTYIKAYEKLADFKAQAAFPTWLIRIGINEALQKIRRKKRFHTISIAGDEDSHLLPWFRTYSVTPELKTIRHENRILLENAINCLPDAYRVVFIMREIEGLHTDEVADCLELTEANVKVRLHRARHLLKEALYDLTASQELFEFGNEQCDRLVERVMNRILLY